MASRQFGSNLLHKFQIAMVGRDIARVAPLDQGSRIGFGLTATAAIGRAEPTRVLSVSTNVGSPVTPVTTPTARPDRAQSSN